MTVTNDMDFVDEDRRRRPTKAVVGSHREDEEVFGAAYDPKIIRRIWAFYDGCGRSISTTRLNARCMKLTSIPKASAGLTATTMKRALFPSSAWPATPRSS